MRHFHGKTILITGAASGIGRALALRLADEGARLYLLDFDEVGLAATAREAAQRGAVTLARHCDVAQTTDVSAAVRYALRELGGVDVLINNAGITYYGRTAEMSAEHWERLTAVNLLAPMQFIRELLPSMLSRDESHVLNVASICGLVGLGRVAAYSASKFGLVGLSESLRAEYGRNGLGVTALCPGFVDTNLFSSAPLGSDRTEPKRPPRWMMCSPEQVASRGVQAMRRNERMVVMPPYARALYAGKRWFPGLLDFANRFQRRRRASEGPSIAAQRAA